MIHIDRRTAVIMQTRRGYIMAMPMTPSEFGVFLKLHGSRRGPGWEPVTNRALLNHLYNGVKDPPGCPGNVLTSIITRLNRKLAHVGLAVVSENHKHKSWRKLAKVA